MGIDTIIKIYKNNTFKYNLKYFKEFCNKLKNNTKNQELFKLINKRNILEKSIIIKKNTKLYNNLQSHKIKKFNLKYILKKIKYINISSKTKQLLNMIIKDNNLDKLNDKILKLNKESGKEKCEKGKNYEIIVFKKLLKIISKLRNIPTNEMKLLKNVNLFSNNKFISEIDGIIINIKTNELIGICEIKCNLDDIAGADYQLNRTIKYILDKNFIIKYKNKIIPNSYFSNFENIDSLKGISYIISSYDKTKNYYDLPSKIFYPLLFKIWNTNINYEEVLKRIISKKYNYNSLDIIKMYKKNLIIMN